MHPLLDLHPKNTHYAEHYSCAIGPGVQSISFLCYLPDSNLSFSPNTSQASLFHGWNETEQNNIELWLKSEVLGGFSSPPVYFPTIHHMHLTRDQTLRPCRCSSPTRLRSLKLTQNPFSHHSDSKIANPVCCTGRIRRSNTGIPPGIDKARREPD